MCREAEREAKRRKKRAADDGDVSYINQRNKVFNQKLSRYGLSLSSDFRFYDQYTKETTQSFERGSGM